METKNSSAIRDILFKEIEALNNGESSIKKSKAIADLTAQAVYSFRLDIENKSLALKLAKSNESVKTFMSKDFSKVTSIGD